VLIALLRLCAWIAIAVAPKIDKTTTVQPKTLRACPAGVAFVSVSHSWHAKHFFDR
jgi:hypothetical protein